MGVNAQEKVTYNAVTYDGTAMKLAPEFAAVSGETGGVANNVVDGKSVITAYNASGIVVTAVGGRTPSSITPNLNNMVSDVKKEDANDPDKVTTGAYYQMESAVWNDISWKTTALGGKNKSMNNGDKEPIYTLEGTGNPYVDIYAEQVWTDGVFSQSYRPAYKFYVADGSNGLPITGLYYSFKSSVDGAFKVKVWVNNGNRQTFVVNATSGSSEYAKAQNLIAEGYINGQDWKQEDVDAGTIDASLVGKRKYLTNEQIQATRTTQTDPYVIGQGNQPFWGYLLFDVKAGEEYWVFQPSSQIGFGGFEFTPGAKKEDVTAIEAITTNANKVWNADAPIYNLAGQKVSKNYKGVVVQNGKKFVQK
jgi:hypothetical protein